MLFGQDARAVAPSDLGNALVLDAVSAMLLHERGVDVGLAERQELRATLHELTANRVLRADRSEQAMLIKATGEFLLAKPAESAEVQLNILANGVEYPLCYRYENAAGQRFLVWMFHAATFARNTDLTQGRLIQSAMADGVEWISKKPLPVRCDGHPQLYVMCRESERTLTVGLFNCFADPILSPTLTLNAEYTAVADTVNVTAALSGNALTLSDVPPFSFCAVQVKK
jgi:hypothetical protein